MSPGDRNISKYWLWLVLIAGISASLPLFPYHGKSTFYLPISYYYMHSFADSLDVRRMTFGFEELVILSHALVSTILAVGVHVFLQIRGKRTKKYFMPESRHFSLRGLLLGTAIMGGFFAGFSILNALWTIYAACLIFAGGRIVDFYLTAYFTTSRDAPDSLER
jgi:hypothetical protein